VDELDVLQEMKNIVMTLWLAVLTCCATSPYTSKESFEAAPSTIDNHLDKASIEEYIIALPPFAFHEEPVESFALNVVRSRRNQAKNKGKDDNYLYVGGDGCWPAKDFTLDRKNRVLHIQIFHWEPPMEDTVSILTMRRVPGGWMRAQKTNIPKEQLEAEQAAPSNH
jgi:hypothetical protein